MRCVLALDSGGTKTDALLVRDDGQVLSMGTYIICPLPPVAGIALAALRTTVFNSMKALLAKRGGAA